MKLIGVHTSIAGGIENAPLLGEKLGCLAIQIFTKNQRQWNAKPLTDKEIKAFKDNLRNTNIKKVIAHDSYLVNLAAIDEEILNKSINNLIDDLYRIEALDISYVVVHPGSHLGKGEDYGIQKIAESLNYIFDKTKNLKASVLLEITAGQGTNIGYKFEQLRDIIDSINNKERVGVCFDTCHAYAAGYNIKNERDFEETFSKFDKIIGLERLKAFHINDSKGKLGSKLDRHANIGEGEIGLEGFKILMKGQKFDGLPFILETPGGFSAFEEDLKNLKTLINLI